MNTTRKDNRKGFTLIELLIVVVIVQEIYHAENFVYSNVLVDLGGVESEGVTLVINEATNLGWSATATHVGIAGESCAIFQGNAAPVAPAIIEGVSNCSF